MPATELQRLRKLAKRWGGNILRVTAQQYVDYDDRFSFAPFSSNMLGVIWDEKLVCYSGRVSWIEVVHEMGHVFASKLPPNTKGIDEGDFFGWEYRIVETIGASVGEWMVSNRDYGVGDFDGGRYDEFGGLSTRRQWDFINMCIEKGIKAGNLDAEERPLSVRLAVYVGDRMKTQRIVQSTLRILGGGLSLTGINLLIYAHMSAGSTSIEWWGLEGVAGAMMFLWGIAAIVEAHAPSRDESSGSAPGP